MGLLGYFGSIIRTVTLYASDKLYHAKGVVSYGAGNGAVVGDARGSNAIDLQCSRTAADMVASGVDSVIGGGKNNKCAGQGGVVSGGSGNSVGSASATGTISGGFSNSATGSRATIGGGESNTASQSYSTVVGGRSNTASGQYSTAGGWGNAVAGQSATAFGQSNSASGAYGFCAGLSGQATAFGSSTFGNAAKADHYGEMAQAYGYFSAVGDAQASRLVWHEDTADATQTELFLDGVSQRFTLTDDSTYAFDILIAARRTDADGESAAYRIEGCIDRNAGVTALVGAITKTVIAEDTAAWDVTAEADDTNDALVIKVTGEAAKTIRWVAAATIVKVSG